MLRVEEVLRSAGPFSLAGGGAGCGVLGGTQGVEKCSVVVWQGVRWGVVVRCGGEV